MTNSTDNSTEGSEHVASITGGLTPLQDAMSSVTAAVKTYLYLADLVHSLSAIPVSHSEASPAGSLHASRWPQLNIQNITFNIETKCIKLIRKIDPRLKLFFPTCADEMLTDSSA